MALVHQVVSGKECSQQTLPVSQSNAAHLNWFLSRSSKSKSGEVSSIGRVSYKIRQTGSEKEKC